MRTSNNKTWKILAVGAALATMHLSAQAVDSMSVEYGTGSHVQMVRLGAQWDWSQRWFATNGYHLGGYWDLSVAQWRGNRYRNVDGQTQNITSIGITPTFRWQQDSKKGLYAEAGIGANLLSELYNNDDNRLSTAFEFGDHVGLGYVFNNGLDLGLKLQHYSNGGIKHPNSGVNFAVVRAAYRF